MAKKNDKETSPKVATEAAQVLKDPKATKKEKSVAGSALSQTTPAPKEEKPKEKKAKK